MDVAVTVVVPIHNVEAYLDQALKSIAGQSFSNIEVICVDDGSTDASADIVCKYAEEDARFSLIQQESLGAGAARNVGLANAKGDYIIFLDADDFFESDLVEKMYRQITLAGADVCMCGAMNFNCENGRQTTNRSVLKKAYLSKAKIFSHAECPDDLFLITSPAPWSKLYRREFVEAEGLRFQELPNSNDVLFYVASFSLADSITYVDAPLVHYRQGRPGSLQNASRTHNPGNYAVALAACLSFLEERDLLESLSLGFGEFAANMIAYNLNTAADLEAQEAVFHAGKEFVLRYSETCEERGLRTGEKWLYSQGRMRDIGYTEYLYEALKEEKGRRKAVAAELKSIKGLKRFAIPQNAKRRFVRLLGLR